LGDFVGFSTRSGSLTARAGMDIVCVGYIGHGMLPTGLNRSRYVALTGLNRSRFTSGCLDHARFSRSRSAIGRS
jgi:hypothetical protein